MTGRGDRRSLLGALALGLASIACDPSAAAREWAEQSAAQSAGADEAIARGDRAEAVRLLWSIASTEPPQGVAPEDARVVRQDAYERLARLDLASGDTARARQLVDRGLALGERQDVFTANLRTTRGRIAEATGDDREAARDYHRALLIQEALLEQALGGSDAP